jgi:transposase-like protein
MAKTKRVGMTKRSNGPEQPTNELDTPSQSKPSQSKALKGARKKSAKRRRRVSRGSVAKPPARAKAVRSRASRTSGRSRRYLPVERARILDTARREGMSGAEAAKRFGISQFTYYLWRKQARPGIRQAARRVRDTGILDVAEEIRRELRDRIRAMIPNAIRSEINSVMSDLTGPTVRKRRRSKRA